MIKVDDEFHKQLTDCKIYFRETYQDVIKRAIDGEAFPFDSNDNKHGDEGTDEQ